MMQKKNDDGKKNDENKRRWSLLPWRQVEQIVEVLEYGSRKYSDNNWQRVDNFRIRYFNACLRHIVSWVCGEKLDKESGLHHLAHAACCIIFLMWGEENINSSS